MTKQVTPLTNTQIKQAKPKDKVYSLSASEVIRDGLRMLFEKDTAKSEQLDILREEVAKGFQQLTAGEVSNRGVMDIFEQVSKESNDKL